MSKAKRKAKTKAKASLSALFKVKAVYAKRRDAASCGDWLAVALKEHCHSEDAFDIRRSEQVLKENGIEWNINRKTHGWIGRFRMNGRQSWQQSRENL